MLIADDVILSPEEAVPEGTEFSLSEMGISARGVDWGDSSVEGTTIETDTGRTILVDRRPKSRTIVARLVVREDSEVDLPTAAYRLQQAIGTVQSYGSWIRRDPKVGGAFAGSLLYRISGPVSLSGLSAWQAGTPGDVILTMVCDFAAYSTSEVESVEGSGSIHHVYELEPSAGTTRGLKRVRVTNDGEEDWRGLIWAEECRDYKPEDATAELYYEAEDLTPKGGAEVYEENTVRHTALTAGWLTILDSEIVGVGHMTHRGVRRLWARAGGTGSVVDLRLRWRALGSSRWTENAIVSLPVLGSDYQLVDLGECRSQVPSLGDERWQFQLQARAPEGSGVVYFDRVYVLPTEQYAVLREPYEAPVADLASSKAAGKGESSSAVGEKAWSSPENIKASDDSRATAALDATTAQDSHYLIAKTFGFALPEGAIVLGIVASVERSGSESAGEIVDRRVRLLKAGTVTGDDKAKTLGVPWKSGADAIVQYGASDDLWGETWTSSQINDSGFGLAIQARCESGTREARVDYIGLTVYYIEEAEGEDRVCFATRSVELRSDGAFRQARGEDDVWGLAVPDGFAPYDTPGGLEERPSRGILIPSQGDLGDLSDVGSNELSAKVITRPGYHYAREAA